MTAIIREELEQLPATIPAPLRWTMERCLGEETQRLSEPSMGFIAAASAPFLLAAGSEGFSKEDDLVYAVSRGRETQEYRLLSVDGATGAEKPLAMPNVPGATLGISGFSLHSDGKRFAMSILTRPGDIWMLEGLDQPRSAWWSIWLQR